MDIISRFSVIFNDFMAFLYEIIDFFYYVADVIECPLVGGSVFLKYASEYARRSRKKETETFLFPSL